MSAFYNEHDPKAAAWLRELIAQGYIAPGVVDERSIEDIKPNELTEYTQCHFFAGIGGWPLALRLAGWPDDKPVWTGSCPCQPFSIAGKGAGVADERHLWPAFKWLIHQCGPPVVFGEQVASKDGRGWLAGVRADLEDMAFTVGAADLCAAGVGAPHIRQRLFWVAYAGHRQCGRPSEQQSGAENASKRGKGATDAQRCCEARGLVYSNGNGCSAGSEAVSPAGYRSAADSAGFWSDSRVILCRDGKSRRIPSEPTLFPLADGLSYKLARRGSCFPPLIRGPGNAIVPELAAEFIQACEEAWLEQPETSRK